MPNRLHQESSPYLKQHAGNPVDWYPWGEEALAKARAEDKPILLSIGYSACHWCHVMEHESFENADIARLMNENFVNIKVDREERPDLDQIYQNVAQLMTRSGGWPLTVFLTPDLSPYFGGTYFPPEDRYGRPGFPRVLQALSDAYRNDRGSVVENAKRLTAAIAQIEGNRVPEHKRPDAASLRKIADAMLGAYDWHNGGFGGAPKFPNTMNLSFLWRFGQASGFGMASEAAVHALTKMARSGLYDHLGGGFHRYSVDAEWAVPHFEKMLYDNALLLRLYGEVLLTGPELREEDRALFTRVLAETTQYVLREMTMPEGGFYSTQDADSEGHEGKFFVWDPQELARHLSPAEAKAFAERYGVTDAGNFEGSRQTVLALQAAGPGASEHEKLVEDARRKLFDAREKRVKPGRDEKVIASWNGLMISGLTWAGRALRLQGQGPLAEQALETAFVAYEFVLGSMSRAGDGDGATRLWGVYKDGKARFNAYLDDYAFMAMAALDLGRACEDASELATLTAQARSWVDVARKRFADRENGGFFFTSDDHEKLIQRPKGIYDQAIPSGNSVLTIALAALGELFPEEPYASEADEQLYKFFPTLEKVPMGMGELACAALLAQAGPVTVAGREAWRACAHPNLFQKKTENVAHANELLICHRRTCDLPLTSADDARVLALKKTVLR
ncbi:MAG: thioredoxin domain-containing protein [Deltaproteobacteria bacterium]|nr:thioredoxin domain-containing protein [Deltaproteobacteria bacterium]